MVIIEKGPHKDSNKNWHLFLYMLIYKNIRAHGQTLMAHCFRGAGFLHIGSGGGGGWCRSQSD